MAPRTSESQRKWHRERATSILIVAAYVLFAVSMFLPAVTFDIQCQGPDDWVCGPIIVHGWECAWNSVAAISWYGTSMTVSNVLFVGAAPILWFSRRRGVRTLWLGISLFLATVNIVAFGIQVVLGGPV